MSQPNEPQALPRIYAWFSALLAEDTALMSDLLAHGLPVEVQHPLRHTTALMEATRLGRVSLVRFLLERGATPVFLCGMPKGTPLHGALFHQQWDIAELLLEAADSAAVIDGYDRTPLHILCMEMLEDAMLSFVQILAVRLIEKGCPLDALDVEGITALHYCIINDHGHLAALLLAHGAESNVLTPDTKVSPLTIAALEKNLAMAALLLEYGADPHLPTRDGTTPFTLMPQLARLRRDGTGKLGIKPAARSLAPLRRPHTG